MIDESRSYGLGLSSTAVERRRKQLESWKKSDTNLEPGNVVYRRSSRVKFSVEVMLLAAVSSGDEKEVERLITEENADVNCRNSDGLTAAHQCCIDDDLDMLKLLVRHGASIDVVDNEGWTPLHAAASCGYDHIVRYLLDSGAFPVPVNNDGQTPCDLGEEYEDIVDMIEKEIQNQGIDVDEVKCEEEKVMLDDAKKLVANPHRQQIISSGGATPLHVAAAKNYTTVINVLLSIVGQEIDSRDDDGWTPLHAAVYWGSVEAAELLVLSGANMYSKTDAGEGFDDLIDPDLEEEFMRLKKLNTCINPEQEPRKRRHQVTRQRSTNNMYNQNASNDSKGGPLMSPGLKRRLSKERVAASKMIDMINEKKELMNSFEQVQEDPAESRGVNSPPVPSQPVSDPPANSTSGYSTQNSIDHVTDLSPAGETQETLHGRSNSLSGSNSPKNTRRKGEISQRMLQRLNLFETSNSSGSGGGGGGGGGGGNSSPLPSSPKTSTPVSSPPVNVDERKRVESSDAPHRMRVGSFDNNSSTTPPQPKRFSFQPKPVLPKGLPSKSMSLDRSESSFLRRALDKMSTFDTHLTSKSEKDKPPVTQTVAQTPTSANKTVPSAKSTPSSSATPITSTPKGELSMDSNSSISSSKDRSGSIVQPEAKRKSVAKKQRETRRPTQPVPADLLQRIKQSDVVEEREFEESLGGRGAGDKKVEPTKTEKIEPKEEEEAVEVVHKKEEEKGIESGKGSINEKSPEQSEGKGLEQKDTSVLQSAYKPAARPASKLISNEEASSVIISVELAKIKPSTEPVEQTASTSNQNLALPRAKSGTRRKPKEKRRSTGINDPGLDEEIPDNLKGIFDRRQSSGDSTDSTAGQNNVDDSVQGLDDTSLSTAAVEYYQQEMDKLRKLLAEEKNKTQSAMKERDEARLQLDHKDKRIIELQRKCEDSSRAYEQEKDKRENQEKRIQQLQISEKAIPDLKTEIQRLKDENGALIRVVGKLSRAPFTS